MLDYRNADFVTDHAVQIGTVTERNIITPANILRQLIYAKIMLATDSTVATRYITVRIYDSEDNHVATIFNTSQAASLTGTWFIEPIIQSALGLATYTDDIIIPQEFRFNVLVENGVAGDTLTMDTVFADYTMTAKDDKSASRRRT